MEGRQVVTMRWVLFWVFVTILAATALVTLAVVLLGVGTTDPVERKMLLGASLVQVISAVIALFYFLFGIKKSADTAGDTSDELERTDPPREEPIHPTTGDLRPELERLQASVESLTALPNRIVGVLAAGRSLSLKELRGRLSIRDDDSVQRAGLEACLGQLVARGVIDHSFGSVESYTLSKSWLERRDRGGSETCA